MMAPLRGLPLRGLPLRGVLLRGVLLRGLFLRGLFLRGLPMQADGEARRLRYLAESPGPGPARPCWPARSA